ncbi:MAG: flagellar basal body-associated FliL family protein, partial [Planctomycetaceae bacterium]|nr:flagellar basal body-associated FliL family protein [Planctomycetaceae bacterium]
PETVALLANHNPLIRNALVLLFAQQDYLELQTPEGKENLKKQARDKVNELLMNEAEKETIEAVLFTNFVMQ